jgi:hypothetical protein
MAIVGALAVTAGYAAGCGDLIVPPGASDGGAEDGAGDDGALGDDGGLGVDVRALGDVDCNGQDASFGPPADLGCTGLYSDWKKRTINPAAQEFDPGFHLWSDGAEKTRWAYIPPNTKIDTSNQNEWKFPVGFKVWKEFKISGRRIETRHFWKRGENDWVRITYRWSDDELSAVALTQGEVDVGGSTYQIPTMAQCDACHSGRIEHMLGFEAVSLSQPESSGLNMQALVAGRLITNPPAVPLVIPEDQTGKARMALGWLHANCGTACHNPSNSSFAGVTGLFMRLEVGPNGLGVGVNDTNTWRTAKCRPSIFQQDAPPGGWFRIKPGSAGVPGVSQSLIPYRDGRRNDPFVQMPPIGSQIPDLANVQRVVDWIVALGNDPQCP